MGLTIEELLRRARAEGVTMVILDGRRISAWHGRKHIYLTRHGVDPADPGPALRAVLEDCISDDQEELLV